MEVRYHGDSSSTLTLYYNSLSTLFLERSFCFSMNQVARLNLKSGAQFLLLLKLAVEQIHREILQLH